MFDITHALLGHTEVRDIKEKLCYVATSADTNPVSYECPNGKFITIDKERFQYTKVLFNIPSLSGMRPPGIRELCHQSIMQCSDEICKDLYANIVLAGGNTLFPGIADRRLPNWHHPRCW